LRGAFNVLPVAELLVVDARTSAVPSALATDEYQDLAIDLAGRETGKLTKLLTY